MMTKILKKRPAVKTKRVSVKIPVRLESQLSLHIEKRENSKKARSKWILDGIEELNKTDAYWLLVEEDWVERGKNIMIQVQVDNKHEKLLDKMIAEVRHELNAESEDLKSCIIRTAIIGKLMKEEKLFQDRI